MLVRRMSIEVRDAWLQDVAGRLVAVAGVIVPCSANEPTDAYRFRAQPSLGAVGA